MKITRSTIFILLAAFVWIVGCATAKPDPLAGGKTLLSYQYQKLDKSITDDYQDYIQKLPPKDRGFIGSTWFLEDGTGQHAVSVEIFPQGENAAWQYAFIYDKENKRVKIIKDGYHRYQS